jgi:predicted SnoaL-like aldol condensation-catalyzing enzyme
MTDQLERNKRLVLDFYEAAINKKDFDAARKYMSPTYKQHNPMADTGPEGLRDYIVWFSKEFPNAHVEIKQVIAEGDRVVLHGKGVNGPAKNGAAVIDIFRIENGLVAEHWDVIQEIPDSAKNSNSMF